MTPDTVLALLRSMISVDTVNASISGRAEAERPLAEYLEALAGGWGLGTTRLPVAGRGFNLLVHHAAVPGAPWLMFESHLDTVGTADMTIAPFGGEVRQGRVYGRGACDTKGSGAAMLWALKRYAEEPGRRNVAIAFTLDEECAKAGVKALVDDQLPALGWPIAGAVVGEPTGNRPVTAHNGVVRWIIRTHGRAAHSSDPSLGRSAISDMIRVVQVLESRYIPFLDARHPLTGRAQCSINLIRGGTLINIVPDRCEIELDRRLVPGESEAEVLPAVEAVLGELRRDDPEIDVRQAETTLSDPALDPASGGSFVPWLLAALGGAEPSGVPYGSDASTFSTAGIPAVVLGPGDLAQAHTVDEWLAIDQLDAAVETYLTLMRAEPNPEG